MKIEVKFERREDGGLRAYADGLPGFVLSNRDPDLVLADIPPVLEVMLTAILGTRVAVLPMVDVSDVIDPEAHKMPAHLCNREYVGTPVQA